MNEEKKTKRKIRVNPGYILFLFIMFLLGLFIGSVKAVLVFDKEVKKVHNFGVKNDHFCLVEDKKPKITRTDKTVDTLYYEVTCE